MPQKSPLHIRSWGTRFDSLHMSPPVSPPTNRLFIRPQQNALESVQFALPRKDDKVPHDASVFVGSLPAHIEQPELTRYLYDHFSEHMEVKSIKVIRDSKGGICAFVQCEDAVAASKLLHTLHSTPPKPFMGRILRYEPARAFRTLLISYRTPFQFIPNNSAAGTNSPLEAIELDLPHAMRLWRHKNSKLYGISYNAEALAAEANLAPAQRPDKCLFLHPVNFDGEAISKLVAYFGPLEYIVPYQAPGSNMEDPLHTWNSYPVPHNAERKGCMDTTCWEVKWNHRDDCICALTTLRRVPHLTVTWAHQSSLGSPDALQNRSPFLPSQGSISYPTHIQHNQRLLDPSNSQRIFLNRSEVPAPVVKDRISVYQDDVFSQPKLNEVDTTPAGEQISPNPTKRHWSDLDFPPLEESSNDDGKDETSGHALGDQGNSASASIQERKASLEGLDADEPESEGSPHMPMTPTSLSPIPRGRSLDAPESGFGDQNTADVPRSRKEVDPTTLFVGGLEMYGPNAWDKDKVEKYFARFDGLEEVKVVHPVNSRSAFAFVKFNNTESPARAVLEEHNRVHEGRTMRVQLRDCNPSKSPWKHRGRCKYQYRSDEQIQPTPSSGVKLPFGGEVITYVETEPSFATLVNAPEDTYGRDAPLQAEMEKSNSHYEAASDHVTTTNSLNPADASQSGQFDTSSGDTKHITSYHEWYNAPSPVGSNPVAPVTSVSNPMHIVPALPYHISTGYYSAPPYVQAYPYPMQFPLQYYNYTYPMSTQHVHQSYNGTMEQGMTNATHHWPVGFAASYVPYMPPTSSPNTGADRSQDQNSNGQAPVEPTGFLQNEQGTLIAVYQPEVLDRYLASAQAGQTGQLTPAHVQSPVGWTQYSNCAQPLSGSSRPFIPQITSLSPTSWLTAATGAYLPIHPSHPQTQAFSNTSHYHRYPDASVGNPNHPARRANTRRDQHYNNNRTNFMINRQSRGAITNGYPTSPKEIGRRMQAHQNVDWSNW